MGSHGNAYSWPTRPCLPRGGILTACAISELGNDGKSETILCPKICQPRQGLNVAAGILMMTSSNENIFPVTGHLCGEFSGHQWIPRTKASGAEFWCFLWSAPESKQWRGWWIEMPSHQLWRHYNDLDDDQIINFLATLSHIPAS